MFRPSPNCKRRRKALAPLARNIALAREEGRALAPAAWASFFALLVLLAQGADAGFYLIPSLALFAGLWLISLFDARYFVIPDGPLVVLAAGGLVTTLAGAPEETVARLAAGAAGYAALRLVANAYEAVRGAPGVGAGDAKLFALAGLWLGFSALPSCLVYAAFSAMASAVIAARQGLLQGARQPIPFGPHLALGLWLAWVFGPLEGG